MKDHTKLLEERVATAVKRLKQLSAERERLETEVRTLQTRLDSAEREQPARVDGSPASDGASDGWQEQRAVIVETLKETIADLRSD
jgi:chromosome segregation ATPase